MLQISKVIEDARADENPQQRQELALLPEVALTCFPNNVGDIGHALVHWQRFGLTVLVPTEDARQDADQQAHHHEVVALDDHVAKLKVGKVNRRHLQVGFTGKRRRGEQGKKCESGDQVQAPAESVHHLKVPL